MKKVIFLTLILSLALSSCSAISSVFATPTITPDVPATALAAAQIAVAETLTAMPTNTPVPPTETPVPTATLAPTNTPEPTPTATSTMYPWFVFFAPNPDRLDGLPQGGLRIENHTGEPSIIVTLIGTTAKREQPVYYRYEVPTNTVITVFWGSYDITVEVGTKKTLFASYAQQSKDKTTMSVYLNKVVIVGP